MKKIQNCEFELPGYLGGLAYPCFALDTRNAHGVASISNQAPYAQITGFLICMDREQFAAQCEEYVKHLLRTLLPPQTAVYLFGSRARRSHRWNSDFDLWIDAEIDVMTRNRLIDAIEESIISFRVDIVTTGQLKGHFGELVHKEAVRWM